jgi:hypothetical protein
MIMYGLGASWELQRTAVPWPCAGRRVGASATDKDYAWPCAHPACARAVRSHPAPGGSHVGHGGAFVGVAYFLLTRGRGRRF